MVNKVLIREDDVASGIDFETHYEILSMTIRPLPPAFELLAAPDDAAAPEPPPTTQVPGTAATALLQDPADPPNTEAFTVVPSPPPPPAPPDPPETALNGLDKESNPFSRVTESALDDPRIPIEFGAFVVVDVVAFGALPPTPPPLLMVFIVAPDTFPPLYPLSTPPDDPPTGVSAD